MFLGPNLVPILEAVIKIETGIELLQEVDR